LCYLKYDKSEEDEPVGEGDNEIKRVKKIKNNGKNSLFCFELVFPKKSVKFFVKDQQKFNEFINSIKNIINYKEISEFEFKEKIGIGKFGIVRRGVHKGTKRKVAIKFIYKEKMTNQDRILLSNEIDILSVIRHPGLINLYEVIDYYDICYIITEYVHGADLYTYVEDKNYKIPEFRIVSIIQQLCCAVYYLNIYGIIHRDIKPEHLLLDDKYEEPTIKLIDFGLSEILFPKEKTCAQFGTIGYTAPEVLRGIPYNKTADTWTIGIMIYLLIIGCLPFDDANEMNKIKEMTINEEIPFPTVICKKKTQESIYLLENILRKDPTKRMNIEEILKSKWVQKFCKSNICKERTKDKLNKSFYLYLFYEDQQKEGYKKRVNEQKKFLYNQS
jgi:serine/threonine protein kinase